MIRRPLVLALALALPASAFVGSVSAADLMQTYELARSGDPQLSAAESGRLARRSSSTIATVGRSRPILPPMWLCCTQLTRTTSRSTRPTATS